MHFSLNTHQMGFYSNETYVNHSNVYSYKELSFGEFMPFK